MSTWGCTVLIAGHCILIRGRLVLIRSLNEAMAPLDLNYLLIDVKRYPRMRPEGLCGRVFI